MNIRSPGMAVTRKLSFPKKASNSTKLVFELVLNLLRVGMILHNLSYGGAARTVGKVSMLIPKSKTERNGDVNPYSI